MNTSVSTLGACSNCEYQNHPEARYCIQCGTRLATAPSGQETQGIIVSHLPAEPPLENRPSLVFDASRTLLRLRFEKFQSKVVVMTPKKSVVLGRRFSAYSFLYDEWLDLDPYGAHHKGVSREHAVLRREDDQLFLMDLGSRNGTFVNWKMLPPFEPYNLIQADAIQLGTFTIKLSVEAQEPASDSAR